MRVVRCLIAFLAMTTCAFGATTTISGQATDSDGTNWSGGTYTLTFVYNPSLGTPVVNGQAFTLSYTGTLDGTGSFSQAVTSTTGTTPVTTPPASGWMVTVCPAFSSSPCYSTAPLAVTGASQSVTTQISAVIKAPRITAIGIPEAYADVEVPAAAGNQYYRVTDNTFRCYTTSWGACGSSSGGALFPSTPGIVCNTSTTVSINCTPTQFTAAGLATVPTLVSGANIELFPYLQGSGTVLTDQSGNNNNCTFGTSTSAPVWNNTGTGVLFNGSQHCSLPNGALNGVKTIELWVALTEPMSQEGNQPVNMLLSDANNNYIGTYGSSNGGISMGNGVGTGQTQSIDRYVGNSGFAGTYSGTVAIHYINGRQTQGYIQNSNTWAWTSTGADALGDAASALNSGWGSQFVLWGMVTYNTVLTPAQIAANDKAVRAQLETVGVHFQDYVPADRVVWTGDSLCANLGGGYALKTSPPYLMSKDAGITQYSNVCLQSQTLATLNTLLSTREWPLLDGASGGQNIINDNAGTNDIRAGTSGAATFALVQANITANRLRYPSIPMTFFTAGPRGDNPAVAETQREAYNAALISAWQAGTLGANIAVIDVANNPEVATLAEPNTYNPTTLATCNTAFYQSDCIHWRPVITATVGTQGAAALLDAQGKLTKPYGITITIPFQVLATFTGATQTIPFPALGPHWQVVGASSQVDTAFVGTGISALTMTVGDSTGTPTQYVASTNLLAVGGTPYTNPAFFRPNTSVAQMNFTAVGGNLNALTAGSMTVTLYVVDIP